MAMDYNICRTCDLADKHEAVINPDTGAVITPKIIACKVYGTKLSVVACPQGLTKP